MQEKAIVAYVFNNLPVCRTTVSLDGVFRGAGHPTVEAVAFSPHSYNNFFKIYFNVVFPYTRVGTLIVATIY